MELIGDERISTMGIFCSKMAAVDRSPSEITLQNGFGGHYPILSESNANGKDIYKTVPEEIPKKSFIEDPYVFPGMSDYGIIESSAEEKLRRASSQKLKPTMAKPTTSGKSGSTKASLFLNTCTLQGAVFCFFFFVCSYWSAQSLPFYLH